MIHTMGKQMNDFTESVALCKTLHNQNYLLLGISIWSCHHRKKLRKEYQHRLKRITLLFPMFFQLQEGLSSHPQLDNETTPRYDPVNVDPLCLKHALSQMFNNRISELWLKSQHKDKIFIGNHNIDCMGVIKDARYRETKTGRFDGIHLYGSSGQNSLHSGRRSTCKC